MKRAIKSKSTRPHVVAVDDFFEIERKVFRADVVELPEDGALQNRPHAFDGVGVDRAELAGEHIPFDVAPRMIDRAVRDDVVERAVARIFVRRQDAVARVDHVHDEGLHIFGGHLGLVDGAGLHAATTFNHADYRSLLRAPPARRINVIVAAVALARLSADIGFVHFDQTGEKLAVIDQRTPDTVHHRPHGRAAHLQIARRLHGAEALLGVEHQRNQQKPALQVDMRVVEYGSDRCGKRPLAGPALKPVGLALLCLSRDGIGTARRTVRPAGPAHLFKMGDRRLLGGEAPVDFDDAAHGSFSIFKPVRASRSRMASRTARATGALSSDSTCTAFALTRSRANSTVPPAASPSDRIICAASASAATATARASMVGVASSSPDFRRRTSRSSMTKADAASRLERPMAAISERKSACVISIERHPKLAEVDYQRVSALIATLKLEALEFESAVRAESVFLARATLAPIVRARSVKIGQRLARDGYGAVDAGVGRPAGMLVQSLQDERPRRIRNLADRNRRVGIERQVLFVGFEKGLNLRHFRVSQFGGPNRPADGRNLRL